MKTKIFIFVCLTLFFVCGISAGEPKSCVIYLDKPVKRVAIEKITGDFMLDAYYAQAKEVKFIISPEDDVVIANDFMFWEAGTARAVIWKWVAKKQKELQTKKEKQ